MKRPHSLLLLFVFVSSALLAGPICVKSASDKCFTDPFPPISSDAPLDVFDRVAEITSECFYDQTFRGLNWKKETQDARSSLSEVSTALQVQNILATLLSKLQASHTEYLLDEDQRYWALKSIFTGDMDGAALRQIGAMFERHGTRWFVRSVFEKSPAEFSGLRRGDEIVSVNDRPLLPVESFSKTAPGKFIKIKFRRTQKGATFVTWLKPIHESIPRSMFKGTVASQRIFLKNGKKIGYFHLWAGTHDKFKEQLERTAKTMQQNADSLILDIRDGLGGAGSDYLDPFLKTNLFTKPLYLLINDGVKSGKESLAYILKSSKRATLIGTKTAGYYLAGRLFDISTNKNALYLAICGDSPVGIPLEGVGVSPDVEVKSPLPYSQGKDFPFQKAIDLASRINLSMDLLVFSATNNQAAICLS